MRKAAIEAVGSLADRDERVVFIGSDLGPGVLESMRTRHPERFFMEGVAEQHVVGMAAGLATEGFRPYVNTIATFLTRRCYEQVAIDLCIQDLPVVLLASGGGAVYAPLGPTHLAVEDMAILRALPNMTVVAPCDADEMRRLMDQTLDWPHPIYVRFAKGGDPVVSRAELGFRIGEAIVMAEGQDGLIVSTGIATQIALDAAADLRSAGTSCSVLHVHTVKPLDADRIVRMAAGHGRVVVVEEHVTTGGLGSAVLEALADAGVDARVRRIGIPDRFADRYGSQRDLLEHWGITRSAVAAAMDGTKGGRRVR
jgi:transketolase